MVSRYHLAFPVVSYLHAPYRISSIEVAVAVLDEALLMIAASGQDDPGLTRPVRQAIGEFLKTVDIVADDAEAPPAQSLELLRGPRANPSEARRLEEIASDTAPRRARLRAVVEQNGWRWESDVYRSQG